MAAISAVHQCLFCPQTFGSAVEKDDHVLNHFAQEQCTDCNAKLLRIGGSLYTIHNAVTCVKIDVKVEKDLVPSTFEEPICTHESQPETNNMIVDDHDDDSNGNCDSYGDDYNDYAETLSTLDETVCVQGMEIKQEPIETITDTNTLTGHCKTESVENDVEHKQRDSKNKPNKKGMPKKSSQLKEPATTKKEHDTKKNYVACDDCGKFMHEESIKRHKRYKHPKNETFCRVCTKVIPKIEFEKHKAKCLEQKKNQDLLHMGKFQCDICKTFFKSKGSIRAHMNYYHDPEHRIKTKHAICELCGKTMRADTIPKHKRIVHRDPGTPACTLCCKTFATMEELTQHKLKECDKSGAFECSICKKVYVLKASLKKHIQKHHDPQYKKSAPVPCQICGKEMRKESLAKHIRIVHISVGKHACKFCARVFSSEEEFLTHKLQCLWKRSNNESFKIGKYDCTTCKITFQLKSSLENHIKLVHEST